MCLALHTNPTDREKKVQFGWKVFDRGLNRGLVTPFYDYKSKWKLNQWKKARTCGRTPTCVGFHVFFTKRDAEYYRKSLGGYSVRRVEVKDIMQVGLIRSWTNCQRWMRAFTCKHCRIVRQKR